MAGVSVCGVRSSFLLPELGAPAPFKNDALAKRRLREELMHGAAVSFRDPSGRTLVGPNRVLREVTSDGWQDLACFLQSPLARELEAEDAIVSTRIISETEHLRILEHERIPFPSYPFEWPPGMLAAAGRLTLELAERALPHGLGIKDAASNNILFRGPWPVFVDVLSFEKRAPGDPIWLAYGQFVCNFLLPLVAERYFGVPLKNTFLANRDGIDPEAVYALAGPIRKLVPPILTLATIPTWLCGVVKPSSYRTRSVSPERAQYAIRRLYQTLRKQLERAANGPPRQSIWTSYEQSSSYTVPQAIQKRNFVEAVLNRSKPSRVLDVGCNAGVYSLMAAQLGAAVVAIDSDPAVADMLWKKARAENADILPLVVDIAQPSPAGGWRNQEHLSFLSRCEGRFDCVLMLGMIHHLLVSERVPLKSILELANDLTTEVLILEYVGPDDPMFRHLLRGRGGLYENLNQQFFEESCAARFRIVDKRPLADSGRVIYYLRKTHTSAGAC
jgi:SAM-dependent methyltransferase